jgi:hypothetical protein
MKPKLCELTGSLPSSMSTATSHVDKVAILMGNHYRLRKCNAAIHASIHDDAGVRALSTCAMTQSAQPRLRTILLLL